MTNVREYLKATLTSDMGIIIVKNDHTNRTAEIESFNDLYLVCTYGNNGKNPRCNIGTKKETMDYLVRNNYRIFI